MWASSFQKEKNRFLGGEESFRCLDKLFEYGHKRVLQYKLFKISVTLSSTALFLKHTFFSQLSI